MAAHFEPVMRKCNSHFEVKLYEALLIIRDSPSLNKQCYASGTSFLLNIFRKIFTTTLLTARNCNMTFHVGFFA